MIWYCYDERNNIAEILLKLALSNNQSIYLLEEVIKKCCSINYNQIYDGFKYILSVPDESYYKNGNQTK